MDLNKLSIEELGQLFPIILENSKPDWIFLFEREKQLIKDKLRRNRIIRIEHIGSTAIPNLISKPTIDILIEIKEKTKKRSIINIFEKLGYHYIPKPENPAPHMMFVKGYTEKGFEGQAYHVHIRYYGDWDELYFRDYLIKHPKIAIEYGNLKKELAKKYRNNREAYTDAKTDFVKRISDKARKEIS